MNNVKQLPASLKGYFLLASPYLADPRFHGGVVFLCDHNEGGALGVIINRPLDIHLGEILEQLDLDGGELDEPVYSGGPVQPERGFVFHGPSTSWLNTTAVSEDVMLTTSRDILGAIGLDEGPSRYLVALGYAGWSEGQLEAELASSDWLACPGSAELLFETEASHRYQAILKRLGIDLNQLSNAIGHA
ncbi:MAG: YqgE/AlgH family protein [Oleiphilaceae bacterium]|nr:YqgE/AlgH family protein [Oleiphilaceae bacterium]